MYTNTRTWDRKVGEEREVYNHAYYAVSGLTSTCHPAHASLHMHMHDSHQELDLLSGKVHEHKPHVHPWDTACTVTEYKNGTLTVIWLRATWRVDST